MPAACLLSLVASLAITHTPPPPEALDAYNVVWETPSTNAAGSMPIGNGEVGINLWTEPGGDLVFYISRSDAWSEASRLLKLGRVRITMDPPLFTRDAPFRQELRLRDGVVHIDAGGCSLDVFVDSDKPVIHLTGRSPTPRRITASVESWRTERRRLSGRGPDAELTSSWTMHDAPESVEVWESADVVLDEDGAVAWAHRNEDSIVPLTLTHQGLDAVASTVIDPIAKRTFGGHLWAAGFRRATPTSIVGVDITHFDIQVVASSAQADTLDTWHDALLAIAHDAANEAPGAAQRRTAAWWNEFWSRSWVFIDGDPSEANTGVPANDHPIRFGMDSNGGNIFSGTINCAGIYDSVFPDQKILRTAMGQESQAPPYPLERVVSFTSASKPGDQAPNSAAMRFPNGFTLEAWVTPEANLQAARILDKLTAGQGDGFLFDIQPGGTLRLIVGAQILTAPNAVKLGAPNRVAATFDPATTQLRLFVSGRQVASTTPAPADQPTPSPVTRAYTLQRWMQACAGRGDFPIKFNGSIFTVEPFLTNGVAQNPDYRRWGDCFWWQNTRLPYHPMLAAGDFEMMDPLFRLYERSLAHAEARAKLYHNVQGAYFPETMTPFGMYSNGDYGWDRTGHEPSEILCPWWQWGWNPGTELVSLLLDRYEYTADDAFARRHLAPMAGSVLRYFDTRFKRDSNGKLVISPTQAVETHWHNVVNDMPVVAGLHDITTRLLALPASIGSAEDRALWKRIHDALPPIPVREVDAVRILSPAEKYIPSRQNCETPELYAVFPHRLYGVGRPDIDLAIEAYNRRHDKATHGWTQDGQFAALLGLTDEAKANLLAKARNSNKKHRFPAMWGPNFDWLPDQTHGGNLLDVTQRMLLQPVGDRLLLLPAWPKEWNVSFKLHAPRSTVVECTYKDGKVTHLQVTPESRRKDVEIMFKN